MALLKDIYQAFETIVGTQNISEDPAILDSYTTVMSQTSSHIGPFYKVATPRPQAVLLPANTEEVQNIVRLCNEHKIKFKAASTFWSAMGYVSDDYSIQLDMRRMNRILEIDVKNQFAVIEPYVTGATLQSETMKFGLNTPITGAGGSCSILAGTSSWVGLGPSAISMGSHSENLLGAEWVLPNGDVLRTGSLGADSGWFCGEGPGPSLRALFRGMIGTAGAFGICTKIAFRLSPWAGPSYLPSKGKAPAYVATLPENITAYTLCFSSWKDWADAVTLLWDSDVAYIGHRQYNMFGRDLKGAMIKILTDPSKQLCDLETLLKDPKIQKQTEEMKIDFQLVIAGITPRDFEYKKKVIDKILADTGGWKASLTEEPDIKNWNLLYLMRMGHKNLNFVMAGAYEGCFGLFGHQDFGSQRVEEAGRFKLEWEQKSTAMAATGGESAMLSLAGLGGGGTLGWEFFTNFDSHEKESCEGTLAFFNATAKLSMEKGWGSDMGSWCADSRGTEGYEVPQEQQNAMYIHAPQPLLFNYQLKVREAFNPNKLGDSYYKTLDLKK